MSRDRSPSMAFLPVLLFAGSLLLDSNTDFIARSVLGENAGELQPYLENTARTLVWLFGAVLLNQLIRRLFWDKLVAGAIGGPVPGVLKELAAVLVYLVVITCIVGLVFDRSVTGFLAALGATGVVLGFALRNLLSDIFTGLAINIDRTFAIGDWVQFNEGTAEPIVAQIREIGWRCTSLTTEEQKTIVLPNGMLGLERVVNISEPIEASRYETSVTVEFSVPVDRVKRVLLASLKALNTTPGFDDSHAPDVLVKKTSALGVEYRLRFWILPWNPIPPVNAEDLVLSNALRYLSSAGLSLAYAKTDIYYENMPERQVDGQDRKGVIELLSRIDVFRPLERDELEQLVGNLERRVVRHGKTLVREGDEGQTLFVLLEGLLDVLMAQDGRAKKIGVIEPGQCFGEMSLLTGENRSATVMAATDSVIYEIDKESIVEIMRERPELAESLSRVLARRQLVTAEALELHASEEETEVLDSLAGQLLKRMRDFLGASRLYSAE